MSNTPRTVVLPLLGIAALAAVFLAGIRTETPFEQAVRRLRVGMTPEQAYAIVGEPHAGEGAPRHFTGFYLDIEAKAELHLRFEGRDYDWRLVDWKLWRW